MMPTKHLYINALLLCILSSCVLEQGKIAINAKSVDKPISIATVQVINNQFVVTGTNLERVTDIKIQNGATKTDLSVESKTSTQLVANTLSNFSLAATTVFDLILSNANASSTFTIDLGQWTVNGSNIYRVSGNVGIGTSAPMYPLHVADTPTDATASVTAGRFSEHPTVNGASSSYMYGLSIDNLASFGSGAASTAAVIGLQSTSMLATGSAGSLAEIYGIRNTFGINATSTTTVPNSYGIYSRPLNYGGSITNSYNLFLATAGTGATVTNEYALYQQSTNAKNFFAGKVGIGTTTPGGMLEINGDKVGIGTVSGTTAGTTLTGVGTAFLSQLSVGDVITSPSTGDERVVTAIANDTSLTLSPGLSADMNASPFNIKKKVSLGSGTTTIGTTTALPIATGAGLFSGVTPKLEILTGSNGWQGYSELVTIRHNSAINTGNPRQLGLLFKMSNEASVGESAKAGGIIMESSMGYANSPSISLITQNTRRLSIDFNGAVGIGTTAPGYKLDVVGDINASGNVRAAGVALSSDRRWKRNISSIQDSTEKLKKINGVTYDWATDEYPEKQFNNRKQIGVIAQDVQAVFPELVFTDKDGFLSVNYPALIAPLIEGFKSQQNYVELHQNQIDLLKKDNLKLKSENAQIKAEMAEMHEALCSIKATLKICKK